MTSNVTFAYIRHVCPVAAVTLPGRFISLSAALHVSLSPLISGYSKNVVIIFSLDGVHTRIVVGIYDGAWKSRVYCVFTLNKFYSKNSVRRTFVYFF